MTFFLKDCQYGMRVINSDGSESGMCGNGIRCIAAYIAANKVYLEVRTFNIWTKSGKIITTV